MKLDAPLLNKLAGLLGTAALRHWMGTLEYRAAFYDPPTDPARNDFDRQRIYIFWHEYILFPFYLRGRCNMAMLLSQHRDAEILSRAACHMGYDVVRGSTNRGGVRALRKLLRKSRRMHLAITPDGPRGPRRQLALGAVYLASRLGMPLVAMGFGYDRPWRVKRAWDQFAIPRPFTTACCVISPEVHVPRRLDRDGFEHFRLRTERLLTHLTCEAEAWAASGTRKINQCILVPQPVGPPRSRRPETRITLDAPHVDTPIPAPHRRAG